MSRRTTFIAVVTALLAVVALAGLGYSFLMRPPGPAAGSGEAEIGGAFTLTDQNGERVSDADFRGKYMLIYFGYTYCPDVCPTELQVMSAALDEIGPAAQKVQPLFITVDPERDTAAQLSDYMGNFHEAFLGLTGTPEEIAKAAKAYRVYYEKVEDSSSTVGYLMDHSSFVYLMGPDGKFIKVFSYGTSPDDMARGIEEAIGG